MLLSLASLAAPNVMSPTRSLLQTISADTLARRDLVPICVIRDTLLFLNGRCAALLGRSGEEFPKGLPLREVVAEADWPRVERSLRRTTLKPGSGVSLIFSAVRKDGSILDLELTGTVVEGGGEIGVVAVANDITQRLRDDGRLNYLAFSDGLTGLPNRTLFLDRLRQSLLASRRTGDGFAVLACDLDGFKSVNDTYGHDAGDQVLRVAAETLRSRCREMDTAARIGGDEFALILPGVCEPDDAALVANRLIAALTEPIAIDGDSCSVGASVGIALYPRDGQTIDTLVLAAHAAMYASKASGGNCSTFADRVKREGSAPSVNFVAWGKAHKLGIGTIDEQHRALGSMVGRVGAEFAAGRDATRLRASLGKLSTFARAHFAAEEALMDRYAVADRAAHKRAHRRLLQDVASLAKPSRSSGRMVPAGFLHEWLLRHVDSADKELAGQLLAKGYSEGGWSDERSIRAPR
jgi:diguanylate cyclase (GGDEF)-like protein/hemerythrin-like metal-binding protein/PAS domain S-box-containing protein